MPGRVGDLLVIVAPPGAPHALADHAADSPDLPERPVGLELGEGGIAISRVFQSPSWLGVRPRDHGVHAPLGAACVGIAHCSAVYQSYPRLMHSEVRRPGSTSVDRVTGDHQRVGEPPYLRIASDLRQRIESGELQAGDALPSINRIAQEWGCAKTTAAKALNMLKAEGLVRGVQGWGTIVVAEGERPASRG